MMLEFVLFSNCNPVSSMSAAPSVTADGSCALVDAAGSCAGNKIWHRHKSMGKKILFF